MVNSHAECLQECEVKHSYILQSADHIFIARVCLWVVYRCYHALVVRKKAYTGILSVHKFFPI